MNSVHLMLGNVTILQIVDYALELNGVSSYINIGNLSGLFNGSQSFTLELWTKINGIRYAPAQLHSLIISISMFALQMQVTAFQVPSNSMLSPFQLLATFILFHHFILFIQHGNCFMFITNSLIEIYEYFL